MAVQKSRRSRATRGHRRSHDLRRQKSLAPTLSIDPETGELHRRHHVTPNGYYRGRQVIAQPAPAENDSEE